MIIKKHAAFYKKYIKRAERGKRLARVMFEITYRCNFRCGHCYIPESYRKKRELNKKEIFRILDQLKDEGCLYLGFTGGEPFMRKDFLDILWHAKRNGFQIIIYTNGSFIDKSVAKELVMLGPNKVDITLHGMTEKVFDAISGVKGSCAKVFDAINLLRHNKVNLGFKTCLLKANEKEICAIEDFADSIDAGHRLDFMLSRRLDGDKSPFRYRGRMATSGNAEIERHYDFCPQIDIITFEVFRCGSGVTQAAITPYGELKLCLLIDWPRIDIARRKGKSGLHNAWERLKVMTEDIRHYAEKNCKCIGCGLSPYCKWCPAMSWLYNKTFTSCDPECRGFAEKAKYAAL